MPEVVLRLPDAAVDDERERAVGIAQVGELQLVLAVGNALVGRRRGLVEDVVRVALRQRLEPQGRSAFRQYATRRSSVGWSHAFTKSEWPEYCVFSDASVTLPEPFTG